MKTEVFGKEYADQYDSFYHDKDYEAECDLIEEIFRRYAEKPVQSILDLGCGTGNHALPLGRRDYQVTCVDRSLEMITQAKAKLRSQTSPSQFQPRFLEGDVRSLDLDQQFDAVIMMFAVLGYQLTNNDVSNTLRTVRRHLKRGGVFVFDIWYGPAVLSIRPSDRVKVIPTSNGKVVRAATGSLDIFTHTAEVQYHTMTISGNQVISDVEEIHHMRYFFPQELALFMENANIQLIDIRAFGDLKNRPNVDTWNVLGIGTAI